MTQLKLGILTVSADSVSVNDQPVRLPPTMRAVFNRIAEGKGEFVMKGEFFLGGDVKDANNLKVQVFKLRKAFQPIVGGANIILSTPFSQKFNGETYKDGYALNLKAFGA